MYVCSHDKYYTRRFNYDQTFCYSFNIKILINTLKIKNLRFKIFKNYFTTLRTIYYYKEKLYW